MTGLLGYYWLLPLLPLVVFAIVLATGRKLPRNLVAGMGIAVGDPDGDGHPDLLVTNFAGEPNTFYRNVEGQLFDDATEPSGIGKASFDRLQWGAGFPDLDDDGRPDLVSVSGHLVPRFFLWVAKVFRQKGWDYYDRGDRSYRQLPLVMKGNGDGTFVDVTASAGDLARTLIAARGLGVADFDGDGRLDLAIGAVSGGIRLLRNVTATRAATAGTALAVVTVVPVVPVVTAPPPGGGNALEILPVAGADRRTVLGTKVAVTAGGRRQLQEFILRPGYASGAWVPLHFGLGAATAAEKVEVTLPGSAEPSLSFENVAAGRLWLLRDGKLSERRRFTPPGGETKRKGPPALPGPGENRGSEEK